MRRIGHARPAGTTWRIRIDWKSKDRVPELGDYVYEDPDTLYRGFKVVGVEETSRPDVFWLVLERLTWQDFMDGIAADAPMWCFVRYRR